VTTALPRERVLLRDGASLRLRALERSDGDALAAAMDRLSERSRYLRFFTGTARLSPRVLAYLTDVDGVDRVAVVAVDPQRPSDVGSEEGLGVGVARYVRLADDPTVAEVAVTVVDEYQRRGVGTSLLLALARHAAQHGVRAFRADVLAQNGPVLAAVERLGGVVTPSREYALAVDVWLPLPLPDRSQDAAAAS
jgi:GNAT superfamily N-acetyltransferase